MLRVVLLIVPLVAVWTGTAAAQSTASDTPVAVVCGANPGERQHCAANTSGGVTLTRLLGPVACTLGENWGYDATGIWVADGCRAEFAVEPPAPTWFGRYTPTGGFKLAETEHGDLSLRIFTYLRYLNELGTDPTFTDSFGETRPVQRRNDLEMNKAQFTMFGWLLSRRLQYNMFVWSSNSTLGLATQVVVAGSLYYQFGEHLTFGMGIGSGLPGTRSLEGSFPFWLTVDQRQIADEFFRPGYTTGFIFNGTVVPGLRYQSMWGNNLNQFGIDAGQLDQRFDTVSGALIWMPTTGEFGRGIGDFEGHDRVATRVGVHASHSTETRQGQPNTDAFDNVQLRLSDGNVIFRPNLFADDLQVEEARYRMFAADTGVKFKGFSADFEIYRRRLDRFETRGTGVLPFSYISDWGYQVQGSAMLRPSFVQVYAGGSRIFGDHGDPSDFRAGVNVFPWKNQVVRWNLEALHLNRSPVGSITLPYLVGSNGTTFHSSLMIYF